VLTDERKIIMLVGSLFIRLLVLTVLVTLLISSCYAQVQRDAPTVHYYAADGKLLGSASMYGNTIRFYAADGHSLGSATQLMERQNDSGRGRTPINKIPGLPFLRSR
jgi:hypothetical protein